ncbi:tyrosine-type recombinase/integrase [Paenibacillus alvei]|uniref:tyrosine-type recombinase/integrase n=1 Tax=Paenibacillus alvei TaxID=44250 RepID=UPI0018CE87B5|nr:tyrosine-type recombinase/integrase [Paenibacillus alvei]MCY9581917.1 tyrosine-type recombinase/integrase [Paenibacillus alvei]MCY9587489.1 tyrosine-type recombinase/integrase [Paenibacillus alvei]
MSDPRNGKRVVIGKRSTTTRQRVEYDLDNAFELFYNAKKSERMRERTLSDYKTHWRYFRTWLDAKYPNIAFRDITQTVLREYVNYMSNDRSKYEGISNRELQGKQLSATTVAIRLRTLKTMFNFWFNEGMLDSDVVKKLKAPVEDEDEIEAFTDEQLRLLLSAPDDRTFAGFRDKVLMTLLADTGLRINEALELTPSLFDFKGRCIYLPGSMNKNRKVRIVPVSHDVIRMVLELINENKTYFDTEFIFITNYGGQLTDDHFRKRLREYGVKVGIQDQVRVSPHTFRHYFCKMYLLNGGDIFTLQRIVAHADIKTTRNYVTVTDDEIHEQHAQFSPLRRLGKSKICKR